MIYTGILLKTIISYFHLWNYGMRTHLTNKCPQVHLQTVPQVNISEYIRKSWYIQQQQVNAYQSEDELYCVTATYNIDNKSKVPFFDGKVISVYNYANYEKINGEPIGINQVLCAREPDPKNPEKLIVSPCYLPNLLGGPYWILAVGPKSNQYDWAIVIGGQPNDRVSNTTCTTSENTINNSGLWIFSREPVMEKNKIDILRDILLKNNISTSKLRNVPQKDCNYKGAFIK